MIDRRALGLMAMFCITCNGVSDEGPDGAPPIDFDQAAMLAHLGSDVIAPIFDRFRGDTNALAAAVDTYCGALETGEEAAARDEALDAWRAAMATWQLAELMQLGPAATDGEALRDEIYSWPLIAPCSVDKEVVALLDDPSGYDIAAKLTNRRGLDALEYTLFSDTLDTICPELAAPEGWNELPEADRKAARCAYAQHAVADLSARADVLVAAWTAFASQLAVDPDGSNVVLEALFYLHEHTKDDKLAKPAGLQANTCATVNEACTADLESRFAHHSKENIAANVRGFRMLFFGETLDGGDGLGFDDFLRAADAADVADTVSIDTNEASAAVEAMPGTMNEALATDYASVTAAHSEVRDVTTSLKGAVPATLGLRIPGEAGGDTD